MYRFYRRKAKKTTIRAVGGHLRPVPGLPFEEYGER